MGTPSVIYDAIPGANLNFPDCSDYADVDENRGPTWSKNRALV